MKKMVQWSCLTASFLVIAFVLWQRPSTAQTPNPEPQIIDALNDCIQQRFKDIDTSFGFRRIIRIGDTPHRFKPENPKEFSSVSDLNNQKVEVALYLASRSVLGDKPDDKEWNQGNADAPQSYKPVSMNATVNFSRKIIKGPVLISAKDKQALPLPSELWEQSKKAMQAFATKDSFEFRLGKWQFTARPVRASEQSCLQCHLVDSTAILARKPDEESKQLKIGDPLGVVLYAYRANQ
jgi:hypothetical protein